MLPDALNPRYVAYARFQKRTPEQMLAEDRIRWPGGVMTGFILWIHGLKDVMIQQYGGEPGLASNLVVDGRQIVFDGHIVDQEFFDNWLSERSTS